MTKTIKLELSKGDNYTVLSLKKSCCNAEPCSKHSRSKTGATFSKLQFGAAPPLMFSFCQMSIYTVRRASLIAFSPVFAEVKKFAIFEIFDGSYHNDSYIYVDDTD